MDSTNFLLAITQCESDENSPLLTGGTLTSIGQAPSVVSLLIVTLCRLNVKHKISVQNFTFTQNFILNFM